MTKRKHFYVEYVMYGERNVIRSEREVEKHKLKPLPDE